MQPKQKRRTYSDFTLTAENCSGYLSMKMIIPKKKFSVKTWCSLRNKLLSIYKKKDMKYLEDINIEVSRITPIDKTKSKYFSFQIDNGWSKYLFICKIENEYQEWMTRLRSIEASINTKNYVNQNNYILKQFNRDQFECRIDKSNRFDLKSPYQNESVKTHNLMNNNKINNNVTNSRGIKSSSVTLDSDVCFDENDAKIHINKSQTMSNLKVTPTRLKNDIDENCKGYLWIKVICDKEKMYVKLWCTLKNEILSIYEDEDGNYLQDISIAVSKICLVNKHRSNNLYFRIINGKTEFTFGTRSENEYEKWINKLQLVSLNIHN